MIAELILEVKESQVYMMRKFPMDYETFVVIEFEKSFTMNKSKKRPGLALIKQ